MITIYGIPNCDTVKKARAWLTARGIDAVFHDFKKQGVPPERLAAWSVSPGWEPLLNRKGMTWRKLDAATQDSIRDVAAAQALMVAQPSVIKRPVVEWGRQTTVGFDPVAWEALAVHVGA